MRFRTIALLILFIQCGCEVDEGDWDDFTPLEPELVPSDTCGTQTALCTETHPRWVEWSDRRRADQEAGSQAPDGLASR